MLTRGGTVRLQMQSNFDLLDSVQVVSDRMAQLAGKGKLKVGDAFVHESIIGSLFEGRIEGVAHVGAHSAIVPSVAGWARLTGLNTIMVDERDPYAHGFQLR